MSLKFNIFRVPLRLLSESDPPKVNTGPLQGVVGPDGAEDLLVVTESNLLMVDFSYLPPDGHPDQLREI